MNELKLLVNRFGYKDDIDDLQSEWLDEIFIYLELDPVELREMDPSKFTDILYKMNLDIIGYPNLGAIKVIYKGDVIGEWAGPELTLKRDKDTKQLYYEVLIQYWSILDDEDDIS
jgi:hypothetical protein